jgi:large subunit ribosomal protein L25
MEKLELEVSKRDVTGKNVRFLRREGRTPAKIYGPGIDSMPVQVETKTMEQILGKAGETDLITLKLHGSKSHPKVLIREVQRKPITDELLHIDFYQADLTQSIRVDVPLIFIGEAPIAKRKNVSIITMLDTINIEALPDHLPHDIEVDISVLEEVDQAVQVKDIKLNPELILHTDPEQMVIRAVEAKAARAEEAAAEEAGEEEAAAAAEEEGTAEAEEAKESEE